MNFYVCLSGMVLIVLLRTVNGYFHGDAYEALHLAYNLAHGFGYVARTSYDQAAYPLLSSDTPFSGMAVWPFGYPLLLAVLMKFGFSGLHAPTVICVGSFFIAWRALHRAAVHADHGLPEALPAFVLLNPPVFERFLYAGSEAPLLAALLCFAGYVSEDKISKAVQTVWIASSLRYSGIFCAALLPPKKMHLALIPFAGYLLYNRIATGSFIGNSVNNSESIGSLIEYYLGGILQTAFWPMILWLLLGQPVWQRAERPYLLTGGLQHAVGIVLRVFKTGPLPGLRFSTVGSALMSASVLLRVPVAADLRARGLILITLGLNLYGLYPVYNGATAIGAAPAVLKTLAPVPPGTLVQDDLSLSLPLAEGLQRALRPDLLWLRPHRTDGDERVESDAAFIDRMGRTAAHLHVLCVKLSGSSYAPALTGCDVGGS